MRRLLHRLPYREHGYIGQLYYLFLIIIKISLVIALGEALYKENWLAAFMAILAFALTYLPDYFKKSYNIKLPLLFEFCTVVFVYASLFMGEILNYYSLFWWWDLVLHGASALGFGIAGFLILYVLYQGKKLEARPGTIAVFAFCFALAIGAVWEIFEFGMDQLFGFHMQKSGLLDTMSDLIVDALGALIASLSGYAYLKAKESIIFGKVMLWFRTENKHLFSQKKR